MSFQSSDGITSDSSYWLPVQVNLNKIDRQAHIVFYGYATQDSRNALKASLQGAIKEYSLSGDKYDTYFTTALMQKYDPLAQAYKVAMDTLDTDSGNKNQDGSPILISFFDGATGSQT